MVNILPDVDHTVPFGHAKEPVSKLPEKQIRKKARSIHARPKLSVHELMKPDAIQSALDIGRRTIRRGEPDPGREGEALNALLDRMRRWATSVSPQYSLAQFVVAAQELSGNRELRHAAADVRIHEVGIVSPGWESRVRKKNKLRKVAVEEDEAPEAGPDVEREDDAGERCEAAVEDGLSKEVLERIERNRQAAIERRRKGGVTGAAQAEKSADAGQREIKAMGEHEMEIDMNDVIDVAVDKSAAENANEEDVDLEILAEFEADGQY